MTMTIDRAAAADPAPRRDERDTPDGQSVVPEGRLLPRQRERGTPDLRTSVVVVDDPADLDAHVAAWDALAADALEPNVFYESFMLRPALRLLRGEARIRIVLVFEPDPLRPFGPKRLCGLFPLERRWRHKEVPVVHYRLWKHRQCFLCTPLVRAESAEATIGAFLDWAASRESGVPIVALPYISGDGRFHQALLNQLNRRHQLHFVAERFTRAFLRPAESGDAYVNAALSGRRRKELKRQMNRLAELGEASIGTLGADGEVSAWVEDFLDLEASGWKGEDGGALASTAAGRAFFAEWATEAFRRGRLMMLTLALDGRPIATKCNVLAGPGSFAIKIAYDEDYARFSPGVQLELENIHRLHARPGLEWMDSCAYSEHFMATRVWTERRTIETLLVSTGRTPGDLLVSALPLRLWLRRRLMGLGVLEPVRRF